MWSSETTGDGVNDPDAATLEDKKRTSRQSEKEKEGPGRRQGAECVGG